VFFFLSKIFDIFLSPLTWAILLFLAAVPWRRRPSRRGWKRRRAAGLLGLAILLFFSSGWVSNKMWWWLERSAVSTYRSDVTYDVVVLLGGIGDERVLAITGEPSLNENVERVVVTHRVLRDGHARYALLTGGVLDPKLHAFNEAAMLADLLRGWGIAGDRILIEDQAKNTHENAVFSARIIRERGFSRVLVVTSAFHVPRSAEVFRAVGIEADFLPADYRAHPPEPVSVAAFLFPRTEALFQSTAAIREILGRYIYRIQGYAKP
jgi:uncharacterized SAM-binding protein YcdF (DUF218 family)